MKIIRKTNILVETKRRFIICQPEQGELFFCPYCPGQMISAEASSLLFNLSRRAVYRTIETGKVHFSETENGLIYICPESFAGILTNETEKAVRS